MRCPAMPVALRRVPVLEPASRGRTACVRGAAFVAAWRSMGRRRSGAWLMAVVLSVAPPAATAAARAQGPLDDEITLRQRSEIQETRARAQAEHEQALADCARRWAMNDCVARAREHLRALLRPLQEAEQVLEDDRRLRRAAQRQRAAERRRVDGAP